MSIYLEPDHWFVVQLREFNLNNPITKQELESLKKDQFVPGPKHCAETKQQIAESNRQYYQTERGLARRKDIAARNLTLKSEELKKRWHDNYEEMKAIRQGMGRTKGSKDLCPRKKRPERRITNGNEIFMSAYEAAKVYGIDPVNIRRKCRKMIDSWRYI
jgi:hypothetical protein